MTNDMILININKDHPKTITKIIYDIDSFEEMLSFTNYLLPSVIGSL